MKNMLFLLSLSALLISCGGKSGDSNASSENAAATEEAANSGKGIGEIKKVAISDPLMPGMVARGKSIYEMKCSPCHLLDDYQVIGPGWKGITERRTPEWIMNMITNVDIMLDKDPTARALLEKCLTRMPNDGISVGDARDILEFMLANDGRPVGE